LVVPHSVAKMLGRYEKEVAAVMHLEVHFVILVEKL
jgi:hypothetical protein